jgi:RNase P/RNase MRP subunit p30
MSYDYGLVIPVPKYKGPGPLNLTNIIQFETNWETYGFKIREYNGQPHLKEKRTMQTIRSVMEEDTLNQVALKAGCKVEEVNDEVIKEVFKIFKEKINLVKTRGWEEKFNGLQMNLNEVQVVCG